MPACAALCTWQQLGFWHCNPSTCSCGPHLVLAVPPRSTVTHGSGAFSLWELQVAAECQAALTCALLKAVAAPVPLARGGRWCALLTTIINNPNDNNDKSYSLMSEPLTGRQKVSLEQYIITTHRSCKYHSGWQAPLVRVLSWYAKVVGLVSSQGMYKN